MDAGRLPNPSGISMGQGQTLLNLLFRPDLNLLHGSKPGRQNHHWLLLLVFYISYRFLLFLFFLTIIYQHHRGLSTQDFMNGLEGWLADIILPENKTNDHLGVGK
jgi:hypothetical protein